MKESYLYEKLRDDKVRCLNCPHYCLLAPGQRGICGVRENQAGKLYSLVYSKLAALSIDPIEKKPLYHFLPGSYSLSLATVGCPLKCQNCQNWELSQKVKETGKIEGKEVSPQEIIRIAKEKNLPSISYTYSDPIIFSEYALDIMKLARKEGIKNIWVSSGFWSKELFQLIVPYLDAANIDLKSFQDNFYLKYCGGRLEPVLKTLKSLKDNKVWIEITTLVIPGLNDDEKMIRDMVRFIKEELGSETPWHISRFFRAVSWKLKGVPDTPLETLKKIEIIGKKAGLKNIHIGNI
jgi:pyruvate formate lyase activating enzyme